MRQLIITFVVLSCLGALSEAYTSKYEQMLQHFPEPTDAGAGSGRNRYSINLGEHPCKRECRQNESMTCYYFFVLHNDVTFNPSCQLYLDRRYRFKVGSSEYIDTFAIQENLRGYDYCKYADGLKTKVMIVNGQLPGPPIEVCFGDTIVADVINTLDEFTTIHWHGFHQRGTPDMDGVPYITQYPVESGQAFRYRFKADHLGTNWWHSHVRFQRGFGLAGVMVARQPSLENVHSSLYDFDYSEHTIILQDWKHDENAPFPQNILINGVGRLQAANVTSTTPPTLYSKYTVKRGGRYRFRLIFNGIDNCPISFSIDNHELIVISSDGADIEPVKVRKLTLHAAERWDFILHADQAVDNYWIRVKGYNMCATNEIHQEAILHYQGANRRAIPKATGLSYEYEPGGKELNALNKAPSQDDNNITVVDLKAMGTTSLAPIPNSTFYITMDLRANANNQILFQMDQITYTEPPVSLLQASNLGVDQFICNKTQQAGLGLDCRTSECRCTNVIEVPAFKVVELVISTPAAVAHPFHLHGHIFDVVGMGVLGEDRIGDIEAIDRRTPLPRRTRAAPLKDTVQVLPYGYVIVRINTNNPGFWFMHCHISEHSVRGMEMVLRVGSQREIKAAL